MLKLITPPTTDPVTVAEMKPYARGAADSPDLDSTVGTLIKAAREAAQNFQNRAYFTQTWEMSFDSFPAIPLKIPLPPLQSVTSVKYVDENGTEHIMDLADFIVDTDSEPGRIAFRRGKSWPSVSLQDINAVKIRFVAGYNDINKVPNVVKLAYMVYVTHRLENPEVNAPPDAFYNLLWPERLVPV
jgi:uncharacterized phiE125 gp8 family phage protein